MYLSKLELHGFKSFAQKTTILFDPGVTAIVGPNGCGKSNVIDAVRWVLGEQRARLLRSEKMENVIFNGTANRRALGLAEVSLTVENTRGVLPTEYSEVTLTRRLYRSGDSEYLLNGTPCRLKDILDLFMDTGMGAGAYSVIELKMIEDILSESAADRRRLFEEAAGVTKYKLRRRQALQKLEATQADLTRVADLADEIEKRVTSLERQAHKAARAARLSERLETLELALAATDFERFDELLRDLDRDARRARADADAQGAHLATAEATLEQQRTVLVAREQALQERQAARFSHAETVRRLEAEARVAAERKAADARALDRLGREREADRLRETELQREQAGLTDRLAATEADVRTAEAAEAAASAARDVAAAEAEEKRAAFAEARRAADTAARAAQDARAALDRLYDRRELRSQEAERLAAERTALLQLQAESTTRARSVAQRLRQVEAAFAATETALQQTRAEADARQATLDAAEQHVRDARLALDTARAEVALLKSLVGADGGDGHALAFLASHPEWRHDLVTVADVVGCSDKDRLAFDAALGEWAGTLVVPTEEAAVEALARLRAADQGRATFLALDRLPARPPAERSPTPAGAKPALDAARAEEVYKPLLRLLLQNVFIVDGLDAARRLRDEYPVARFVTRAGEWTDAKGAIHGGSPQPRAAAERLGRRERLEKADATIAEAEAALVAAEGAREGARAARESVALADAEAALERARATRDDVRQLAHRAAVERQALVDQLARLEERTAILTAGFDQEPDGADLQAALDGFLREADDHAAVRDAAEAEAEAAEQQRRAAEAAWNDARLALVAARAAHETLGHEAARIAGTLADLATREAARVEEEERLRVSIAEAGEAETALTARLDEERTGSDTLEQAVTEAEGALLEVRAVIAETERAVRAVRQAREVALQQKADAEVRLAELRARQDALLERLREDHGASLTEAAARIPDSFDVEAARAEVPKLKDQLRGLGAVNALALESYEEEKERLDFLRTQQRDLQEAEGTLLSTIEEINATAAERFGETFEQVRGAFQKLFRDLFGETASADLTLAGDDPLEAPVEIFAQPRGKKPVTLSQLSGGEKTLTAIALLFAIYLVKPSPFCILDEVDAPLDDANIERFMRLIRSFADHTQFILVTHNKLTMEAADRMYGITMPEPGVSRLVGVRFDAVEPEAEAA